MAKDGNDVGVSWKRHPLKAASAWLDEPEGTRRQSLLIGILGTLLVSAALAVIGIILATATVVDLEEEVPLWLAVSVALLALALGTTAGALAVRRFYHTPKLAVAVEELASSEDQRQEAERKLEVVQERLLGAEGKRNEVEAGLGEAEAQLREAEETIEKAEAEVADLEPHRDIRERIESYAEQIRLLLSRGLGTGLEDVEEELLVEPARLMEEMTGCKVHLSIWEPQDSGGETRWAISHRADHSDRECNNFSVPLDASWIASDQKLRPDDAVFGLSDLVAKQNVPGDDLIELRKAGFKALLCSRVATGPLTGRRRENTDCLVALAKEPGAFSAVEGRYLQFLGRLLSLHFQITELMARIDEEGASSGASGAG
jgi:hypothetical protein